MTRILLASTLAWLCAAQTVSAQVDGPGEHQQQARELFDDGMRAVRAGLFATAVLHFRRSLRIDPRVSTAVNLAAALRSSGAELDAERILRAILRGAYGRVGRSLREAVEAQLDAVRGRIATAELEVVGGEPVYVTIDGREVRRMDHPGTTRLRLDPGERTIGAVAPGFRLTTIRRSFAPGSHERLRVELVPLDPADLATLTLRSPPGSGAVLEIAGYGQSRSELVRELAPGAYVVRAIGGHGTQERSIELEAGEEETLMLQPPERSLVQQPWLWVGVATVVVAAAAGLTVWLLKPEPTSDPTWGNVQALTAF